VQASRQKPCPCCGQLTDAEALEIARQNQSGPGEEPEQAFRRGYHHGVHIVVEALKGRIDLVLWQMLNAFANSVSNWRTAWSERKRRRPAPARVHSAPEPSSLLRENSTAGADQLWGVLRYRPTAAGGGQLGETSVGGMPTLRWRRLSTQTGANAIRIGSLLCSYRTRRDTS
jgi:hypothetical protein